MSLGEMPHAKVLLVSFFPSNPLDLGLVEGPSVLGLDMPSSSLEDLSQIEFSRNVNSLMVESDGIKGVQSNLGLRQIMSLSVGYSCPLEDPRLGSGLVGVKKLENRIHNNFGKLDSSLVRSA